MELIDAIKARRIIRRYKQDPISKETILKILESANLAPTAGNTQPWKFIVLHRSILDQLAKIIETAVEDRIKGVTEDGMRERLKELPIPTDESGDKIKGLKNFFRLLGKAPIAIVAYAEKPGDIIVACKNFGCGSSREHVPLAIKALGISCVVARTFARIFYRNAFNIGLPILECADASDRIEEGQEVQVNLDTGQIQDLLGRQNFQAKAIPPFMQELVRDGGLMNHIAKRFNK